MWVVLVTVFVHPCGWPQPHSPHVSVIVHPNVPTFVTHLSCPGEPVPAPVKPT